MPYPTTSVAQALVPGHSAEAGLPPVVVHALRRLERELVHDYAGLVPAAVVRELISDALRDLAKVKVAEFIPALVMRTVRERADRVIPTARLPRRLSPDQHSQQTRRS